MVRSMKEMHGYAIHAKDGELGKVEEFYFDDRLWRVRYLIVNTGSWLSGRKVLISPSAFGGVNWSSRKFNVNLTKEQIEKSPDIDADKPVSRQHEIELARYYNWPIYWTGAGYPGAAMTPMPAPVVMPANVETAEEEPKGDLNLRSAQEVFGYHIGASDGEVGHVEDFIVDDATWHIRYMVVDTRNWLPGRKVLVALAWVGVIDWASEKVRVDLTQESIRNSPVYDPSAPINRAYEEQLFDFYGRPKYW